MATTSKEEFKTIRTYGANNFDILVMSYLNSGYTLYGDPTFIKDDKGDIQYIQCVKKTVVTEEPV